MSNLLKGFTAVLTWLILLISCRSPAQLSIPANKDKIWSGVLNEVTFNTLRQLIASRAGSHIKDTVIIRYDYNKKSCWDLLDQQDDLYIQNLITNHNKRVQRVSSERPNVSVFDFREPGNNLNKFKKWNSSILIDSSKQLLNLIFKKTAACGNSIIVLPDKRYLFIRSDPHSEALDFTSGKIQEHLTKK